MTTGRYPVKKTGSTDNERLQINKALDDILDTLSRSDQWDEAASWGDHAAENYATALSELDQFADFGIPSTPILSKTRETAPNGTESHAILAAWSRAGDDSIVYDLEIRESDPSISIDPNDPSDVLANASLYSVPIISNDPQDTFITYKSFFDSDTRYFFRVRIRRNTLVSNWSGFADIVTNKDEEVPPAPGFLTASPIADGVRLDWIYDFDDNPGVAKIEILRNGSVVDTVSRPSVSYIDEPLPVQQQYSYSVRAVSFFGIQSALSNVASAFPNRSTVTIRQPTQPTERPDGSPLQNGDRWIDTSNGDRPYVYVNGAWVAEYTEIPGNNINENSMDGNRITARTLEADRIATGTLTANEINVNDLVANSTILVGGDNISELTNDAGFTDFDQFDVQSAIANNVTLIDGSKITTGTIDASDVNLINLDADNITTGTVAATRIDVSGVITAGNLIVGGDNVSALTNDAGYTDFDEFDVQDAITNNVTIIDGSTITTGTINASLVDVINIDADEITTGTLDATRIDVNNLIVKNIQTATSGPRVEIADVSVDPTYALWIGDGPKTDGNASIYVRQSGSTEFDGTFIRDLTVGTSTISNGAVTLGDVDAVSGTLGTASSVIASFNLTFPTASGSQTNQGVLIVAAISCTKSGLTEPENCNFVIEVDGSIVGFGGCQLIPNELAFVASRASACVTAFIPNPSGNVTVELFGSSDSGGVTVDGDLASIGGKK